MWTPWIVSPAHPTAWAPPLRGPRRWLIDALLRASALMVRTAVRVQRAPLLAPVPNSSASGCKVGAPALATSARWHRPMATVIARQRSAAPTLAASMAEREFHAEAGAPEGALYVDGQFIGRLPGVSRL